MVDSLRGDLRSQRRLKELLVAATGLDVKAEDRPGTLASVAAKLTDGVGTKSTQRLSLQALDTGLALCTWPGETKDQAQQLYKAGRIGRLLRFLNEDGQVWQGRPDVHLAYRSAQPRDMLYLTCHLDVDEYAYQWLNDGLGEVGEHQRDRVRDRLWPWLLNHGYAHPDDMQPLRAFLPRVRKRPVLLRASIALRRLWPWEEATDLDRADKLAEQLRTAAVDVLSALGQSLPPAFRSSSMTTPREPRAADTITRDSLESALLERAIWTHSRLTAGQEHGVELQEETITESLLLDISIALPPLTVKTFTRHQESRNGADWQWEWWFEGRQWFGLRIQAKRLKRLRSGRLGYDIAYRSGSSKKPQIDLLIRDANKAGMQAAYALYNGPGLNLADFRWGCPRLPPKASFFGVSLLPAPVAQSLLATKHDDCSSICGASRPWSCLASCDWAVCSAPIDQEKPREPTTTAREDLAQRAALSYARIEALAQSYIQEQFQLDIGSRAFQTAAPLLEAPPPHVRAMLDPERQADVRLPRRVGGVTVFRTGQ